MNNCPNEEDMACYIDGLLPAAEVRQMERHLLKCCRCREIEEVTRNIIGEVKTIIRLD